MPPFKATQILPIGTSDRHEQTNNTLFAAAALHPRMSRAAAGRPLLLLRLALLLLCAWSARTLAGETEIIVSPDQSAVTVDRGMLRAIFTTRLRQWPDGTPIRLFVMPDDNALHDQFCREQLGMYPYVLRELWDRLLYTGTGLTPTVVHTEAEMR